MDWNEIKNIDDLPEHGKKVIAFYKNRSYQKSRKVMAQFFERYKEECRCDDECDCEYSETKDAYYYRDGWYEIVDNWPEWSFIPIIEGDVTHWTTLPEDPK